MENNYSSYIPEELARKLLDFGMLLFKYPVGNYDGCPSFDIPKEGEPGWADGSRYRIPTYSEVFDWFIYMKSVIITLNPFITFTLKGNIGYTWKISYIDINDVKMKSLTEQDVWDSNKGYGGSFHLVANDAIEHAMKITSEIPEQEYIEVNIEDL